MAGEHNLSVVVERELRPIRAAFIVNPREPDTVLAAIERLTTTWGGQHSVLVPGFSRRPAWWDSLARPRETAEQILLGYLAAFRPDAVVAMRGVAMPSTGKLGAVLGSLPGQRVLGIDESLGLDVLGLYQHLHETEFRFLRRDPERAVLPTSIDPRLDLLIPALTGQLPLSPAFYRRAFTSVFDAEELAIDLDTARSLPLLAGELLTPLSAGSRDIESFPGAWWDATFFVMDATSAIDIIDFWNLRAYGAPVVALPTQLVSEALLTSVGEAVERHFRPMRLNPEIMQRTSFMKGRAVRQSSFEEVVAAVPGTSSGAMAMRPWYPSMWSKPVAGVAPVERSQVRSRSESVEVEIQGESLTFSFLGPTFEEDSRTGFGPRCINSISFRGLGFDTEPALVVPSGLDGRKLLGALGPNTVQVDQGAFEVTLFEPRLSAFWSLPSGLRLFSTWAQARGLKLEISSAGRMAAQVVRSVEWGAVIDRKAIIEKLHSMSSGTTVSIGEWISILTSENDGDREGARAHLDALVSKGVLETGLEVQCTVCQQHGWFALGQLDSQLRCSKCLQYFRFPQAQPPINSWRMRTIGPFSLPDYAHGSYTVAFARAFLSLGLTGEQSWIPSFSLLGGEVVLEGDFASFWRRHWSRQEPELLIGECKTFGEFKDADVARLGTIASCFPEALVALCFLREGLTESERRRILKLAKKFPDRVVILTARELLARSAGGLWSVWNPLGGRHQEALRLFSAEQSLRELAKATCFLYLEPALKAGA